MGISYFFFLTNGNGIEKNASDVPPGHSYLYELSPLTRQ